MGLARRARRETTASHAGFAPAARAHAPARLEASVSSANGGIFDWQTKLMADLTEKYAPKAVVEAVTAADDEPVDAEVAEAAAEEAPVGLFKRIRRLPGRLMFWRK